MLEFLSAYGLETVVVTTIAIVQAIKGLSIFQKWDTKLISALVSTVLVALLQFVVVPDAVYDIIDVLVAVVLPSLGYDRILTPLVQTVLNFAQNLRK